MKKIISILLLFCTLTLCLTSCKGDNNDGNNVQDCKTTGVHTYENGECTGCGLKVYDVLKQYIIQNGTNNKITMGSYNRDQYVCDLYYSSKDNYIEIGCDYTFIPGLSDPHTFYIGLKFTPYTLEDGEYDWAADCYRVSCHPRITGKLDPHKFSTSTTTLDYSSSEYGASEVANKAIDALKGNLNEHLVDFCNNIGENITIKDLGFDRFQ